MSSLCAGQAEESLANERTQPRGRLERRPVNEATPENVAYPNQAWPENVRASGCALIAQYPVVQFGVERGDHGHALAVGH